MTSRRLGAALLVPAIIFTMAGAASGATPAGRIARAADPVAGRYIVTLRSPAALGEVPGLARAYDARVTATYRHALAGFAAQMSEKRALALSRNPLVASVEEDGVVKASGTQTSPPWGLDRIDQRDLPLAGTYVYTPTGAGVTAYIIDTGIRISHTDFGGRASYGRDTVDNDMTSSDCNGHGTHVAGTVGGTTYGVAKAVSLIAVRVLDCNGSGYISGVVAGVDWVTGHHTGGPAVANMSLGGGASSSLDTAVQNSINDGITYAVAAGNGNTAGIAQDACKYSPARVEAALTVSATDSADRKASWANYGTCVDLFAPGVSIKSAWSNSDTSTNTISGTSMATPHVAGAAALHLQNAPDATPAQVASAITGNATTGKVSSAGSGSPNRLLYMGYTAGTTDAPPLASFTYSCTELECAFNASASSDDAGISSYAWTFGDETTGSGATPTHTYAAAGSYTVTLTVQDTASQTDTETKTVTVSTAAGSGITLSATPYKVKGTQRVDLTWTGTDRAGTVTITRSSTTLPSTTDDGAYTDNIGTKGGGSYTYQLCESGTTNCSNSVTVTF